MDEETETQVGKARNCSRLYDICVLPAEGKVLGVRVRDDIYLWLCNSYVFHNKDGVTKWTKDEAKKK